MTQATAKSRRLLYSNGNMSTLTHDESPRALAARDVHEVPSYLKQVYQNIYRSSVI